MIRDLMVRFGRQNLGFVWSILEPMILCTGVLAIWSQIHNPLVHDLPVIGFVLTGYMPLTMSRHMNSPMIRLISNNSNLLYHSRLSVCDFVVAKFALEFISTTAALCCIYSTLLAAGLADPVKDWGLLLGGWLLVTWLFAGFGLLIIGATEMSETVEKFIQPIQYLSLPLSGVFFMVDWLPNNLQTAILWNPVVHGYEMFRGGYFGDAVIVHYNVAYIIAWAIALTVVGVAAVSSTRDYVHT